jgi:hypothetical protein
MIGVLINISIAALRPFGTDQALRNDGPQVAGQIHQQLLAALFGEEVDDPVDCLIGAVGMQRPQAQVSRLSKGDGVFHRLGIADLADENDVRRLTERVLQRVVPRASVDAHLTMRDEALL